jgi:hypothetical protein
LIHDGKIDEANKLSTSEMQDQWALPAKDRAMMLEMIKATSSTEQQYSSEIKADGVLVIDGQTGTLTVTKTTKDKGGTSTSTTTQNLRLDGTHCLVNR